MYPDCTHCITCTVIGQKYFRTDVFHYIFHIKSHFFKKLLWRYFPSDFHEIFTDKQKISRSLIVYLGIIFILVLLKNLRVEQKDQFWRYNFTCLYRENWCQKVNSVFTSFVLVTYKSENNSQINNKTPCNSLFNNTNFVKIEEEITSK